MLKIFFKILLLFTQTFFGKKGFNLHSWSVFKTDTVTLEQAFTVLVILGAEQDNDSRFLMTKRKTNWNGRWLTKTHLFLCPSLSVFSALGQIMLYVDGMNGLISHNETVQWLYTLVGSKVKNMNIRVLPQLHSRYTVKSTPQHHLTKLKWSRDLKGHTKVLTALSTWLSNPQSLWPPGPLVARFWHVQHICSRWGNYVDYPLFPYSFLFLLITFLLSCVNIEIIFGIHLAFFNQNPVFPIILYGKYPLSVVSLDHDHWVVACLVIVADLIVAQCGSCSEVLNQRWWFYHQWHDVDLHSQAN